MLVDTHHLDLLRCEFESHGPQIVGQSLLLARSRDRDDVLVNAPPQGNLCWRDGVLLRQSVKDVISGTASTLRDRGEWTVGFSGNALLLSIWRFTIRDRGLLTLSL